MKAIILAAGKGKRLGDISEIIPKPMIKINGKPILEHNIDLCRKNGILDIYINLHHLPYLITDYFEDGSDFGVSINYSFEEQLYGTAGGVKRIIEKFWNSNTDPFFIIYGDNFSNFDLEQFLIASERIHSLSIIGFHFRKDTQTSGVAEFDQNGKIIRFIEKPKPNESQSHWVNAGIYYCQPEIITYITDSYSDFGHDVFPLILKRNLPLHGIFTHSEVKAFDTKEMLSNHGGSIT